MHFPCALTAIIVIAAIIVAADIIVILISLGAGQKHNSLVTAVVVIIIALGARHHPFPLRPLSSYSLVTVVISQHNFPCHCCRRHRRHHHSSPSPLEPDIMRFPCHHHRRHCYRHHRRRRRHPATDISIIIIIVIISTLYLAPRFIVSLRPLRVSRRVALSCRRHTRHDRSWKLRALFYLFQNFASFSFIVLVSVS